MEIKDEHREMANHFEIAADAVAKPRLRYGGVMTISLLKPEAETDKESFSKNDGSVQPSKDDYFSEGFQVQNTAQGQKKRSVTFAALAPSDSNYVDSGQSSSKKGQFKGHFNQGHTQPFWSVAAVTCQPGSPDDSLDTRDGCADLYDQWQQISEIMSPKRSQALSEVDPFFQKRIPDHLASVRGCKQSPVIDVDELYGADQKPHQWFDFNHGLSKTSKELPKKTGSKLSKHHLSSFEERDSEMEDVSHDQIKKRRVYLKKSKKTHSSQSEERFKRHSSGSVAETGTHRQKKSSKSMKELSPDSDFWENATVSSRDYTTHDRLDERKAVSMVREKMYPYDNYKSSVSENAETRETNDCRRKLHRVSRFQDVPRDKLDYSSADHYYESWKDKSLPGSVGSERKTNTASEVSGPNLSGSLASEADCGGEDDLEEGEIRSTSLLSRPDYRLPSKSQVHRPSRLPVDSVHRPSRSPVDRVHRPSRSPVDRVLRPSRSPVDRVHRPSRSPVDRVLRPLRSPVDRVHRPSRSPVDKVHRPSRSPVDRAHRPSRSPVLRVHRPSRSPVHRMHRLSRSPVYRVHRPSRSPVYRVSPLNRRQSFPPSSNWKISGTPEPGAVLQVSSWGDRQLGINSCRTETRFSSKMCSQDMYGHLAYPHKGTLNDQVHLSSSRSQSSIRTSLSSEGDHQVEENTSQKHIGPRTSDRVNSDMLRKLSLRSPKGSKLDSHNSWSYRHSRGRRTRSRSNSRSSSDDYYQNRPSTQSKYKYRQDRKQSPTKKKFVSSRRPQLESHSERISSSPEMNHTSFLNTQKVLSSSYDWQEELVEVGNGSEIEACETPVVIKKLNRKAPGSFRARSNSTRNHEAELKVNDNMTMEIAAGFNSCARPEVLIPPKEIETLPYPKVQIQTKEIETILQKPLNRNAGLDKLTHAPDDDGQMLQAELKMLATTEDAKHTLSYPLLQQDTVSELKELKKKLYTPFVPRTIALRNNFIKIGAFKEIGKMSARADTLKNTQPDPSGPNLETNQTAEGSDKEGHPVTGVTNSAEDPGESYITATGVYNGQKLTENTEATQEQGRVNRQDPDSENKPERKFMDTSGDALESDVAGCSLVNMDKKIEDNCTPVSTDANNGAVIGRDVVNEDNPCLATPITSPSSTQHQKRLHLPSKSIKAQCLSNMAANAKQKCPPTQLFKKRPIMKCSISERAKDQQMYVENGRFWCGLCQSSFNSVDLLLQHYYHSKKHLKRIARKNKPWKSGSGGKSSVKKFSCSQQIQGVDKLQPVFGFYCSLCSVFCGDVPDSMLHLGSGTHCRKNLECLRPFQEQELVPHCQDVKQLFPQRNKTETASCTSQPLLEQVSTETDTITWQGAGSANIASTSALQEDAEPHTPDMLSHSSKSKDFIGRDCTNVTTCPLFFIDTKQQLETAQSSSTRVCQELQPISVVSPQSKVLSLSLAAIGTIIKAKQLQNLSLTSSDLESAARRGSLSPAFSPPFPTWTAIATFLQQAAFSNLRTNNAAQNNMICTSGCPLELNTSSLFLQQLWMQVLFRFFPEWKGSQPRPNNFSGGREMFQNHINSSLNLFLQSLKSLGLLQKK